MCGESKSKSQVYVKDFRTVMLHEGKRLIYPQKYHKIVKHGTIKVGTNSEGNTALKLLYGETDKNGMRPAWSLVHIISDECHSKAYYTMYKLLLEPRELHKSCYEPFGLSRRDLRNYVPVLDIKETGDPNNPFQLVNTLYLAKKGCSVSTESGEVDASSRKEKGLNGKQLYNSTYGKQTPNFFVIKDDKGKVEFDKTILCFPVMLFASIIIFFRKLLTFLPMKLGECLLRQQNFVAKVLGHIFFTPFVPIKFIVDILAIFFKSPVLLFIADEKKYGNTYFVLWKYELIGCFYELKSDCSVIKTGIRPTNIPDYHEFTLIGTWNELNVRCQMMQFDLP